MLELVIAASATALATGLGAIPVWLLGHRATSLQPALTGVAGGVMAVAAVQGLLIPATREGTAADVAAGFAAGIIFLLAVRAWLGRPTERVQRAGRSALIVFIVLLVHSLPEGFAIGTAYASNTEGLAAFIVIAIAIQNIPEGTSIAIPMAAAGAGRSRQFWAAVLTSVPQPIGAVVAYFLVEEITALLPLSFAFAAGAMLMLVVAELGPTEPNTRGRWLAGALAGAAVMAVLGAALGA
jgi:ZIP family zinc transporter